MLATTRLSVRPTSAGPRETRKPLEKTRLAGGSASIASLPVIRS
jgi:hypothetical protein